MRFSGRTPEGGRLSPGKSEDLRGAELRVIWVPDIPRDWDRGKRSKGELSVSTIDALVELGLFVLPALVLCLIHYGSSKEGD